MSNHDNWRKERFDKFSHEGKKRVIAVYGSLRKLGFNHERHDLDLCKHLGDEWVEGFDMYHDRPYPRLSRGSRKVFVEVYEVPEIVYKEISLTETSTGYCPAEIDTSFGKATIFIDDVKRNEKDRSRFEDVLSGDWIAHVASKECKIYKR